MEELNRVKRRDFLKQAGTLLAVSSLGTLPLDLFAKDNSFHLTILHTNDVHSRVEPFPMDGSRNQGLGGAARRAALIAKIRKEQSNVLLFDSGDMVQGTPYFNLFDGGLEMELMNKMGYDAATLGNHEFDNGLEHLKKMIDLANFPILSANYDFAHTALEGKTMPYKIFKKQGIRIGVFGLGIELEGLVDPVLCEGVQYHDPIPVAIRMADYLKYEKNCSVVICLSHLGYQYNNQQVSDIKLAENTRNIDLILGGHTHTFLEEPTLVKNLIGEFTTVNQVGSGGIHLGRIDYKLEKRSGKKRFQNATYALSDLDATF